MRSGASSRDSQTQGGERGCLAGSPFLLPPSLLFMDSLFGLLLLRFFRPYSVSLIPKMIQLHGCH